MSQAATPRRRYHSVLVNGLLWLVAGCVVLLACGQATAGPLSAVALLDTQQARIGDPLRLTLRVDGDRVGARVLFPQTLEPFLASRMQAVVIDSASTPWRQVYDLRLFDVGLMHIPTLLVPVLVAGDTLHLQTLPLEVEITPVLEVGDTDLRRIKPPWVITGGIPLWIVVTAAILVVALIAFFVWCYLWRRTSSPVEVAPRAPTDYCREFSRIESMGLLTRGALKLYYTHLADVLRRFLEEQVGIDALERTTAEIAGDLTGFGQLNPDLQLRLLQFLRVADLVKFARARPPQEEAEGMPGRGRALIVDVEAALSSRPMAQSTPTRDTASRTADAVHDSCSEPAS